MRNPDAGRKCDGSPAGYELGCDGPKQARLAAAVGAHDPQPLARLHLKAEPIDDVAGSIGDGELVHFEHRHGESKSTGVLGINRQTGRSSILSRNLTRSKEPR